MENFGGTEISPIFRRFLQPDFSGRSNFVPRLRKSGSANRFRALARTGGLPKMPKINSTRFADDRDVEFIHNVVRLAELCPRAVAELLLELALRAAIEERLAYYLQALGRLGPEVLDAVGANQLPSPRGHRRRPRRDRIPAAARKKRALAKPWRPVPFERSERRPPR
jgi:hypothetical protein